MVSSDYLAPFACIHICTAPITAPNITIPRTQLICFRRLSRPVSSCLWFCGQLLPFCDSVYLLGTILQFDLSDKPDIQAKTMAFIYVRPILFSSALVSLILLLRWGYFMRTFCLSTAVLSRDLIVRIYKITYCVSFNNVIRRIWKLLYHSHTGIVL